MERLVRLVFLVLFIIGFVGAVASADRSGNETSSLTSLFKDVQLAEEANEINSGRWNLDSHNIDEDGLAQVEDLFAQAESQQQDTH